MELPWMPSNVRGDPGRMAQLLVSLAMFACDQMPTGGQLTVSLRTVPELPPHLAGDGAAAGGYIRLVVADTGAGVDEETRLQLFDPLAGAQEPERLRLPEAYGIVEQHGGVIWAASDAGRGTEFQVYFPAVTGEATAAQAADARPSAPLRQMTLLVVARDAALRRVAADALKGAGHEVVEAADAGEAALFSQLNPGSVDLIVADLEELGMPGPKLVARLRQWHPAADGVFLSAVAEASPRMVAKPFSPDDLVRAVGEALASLVA
jgi:CheY-like chemotaxis protein